MSIPLFMYINKLNIAHDIRNRPKISRKYLTKHVKDAFGRVLEPVDAAILPRIIIAYTFQTRIGSTTVSTGFDSCLTVLSWFEASFL